MLFFVVQHEPEKVGVRYNLTARQYAGQKVVDQKKPSYTGVLANRYRNGTKSIAAHSDSEKGLAPGIPICSVSIGAQRDFVIRSRNVKPKKQRVDAKVE